MKATLTALVHGSSGVGKSWLADTVPGPRLILDAEGRARYTPSGPKISWDPRASAPPVYDGTWETCVVTVPEYETFALVHQWARTGQLPFVSYVIDSLMEAQKRLIDKVAGMQALAQTDWGEVLRRLEGLVRSYRDLTLIPDSPTQVVVFTAGSKLHDEKQQPLVQGALQLTVPYYLDVVGYYFKVPQPDGTFVRSLLVDEQPGFVAKDNTDRLPGPIISNPNFTDLFNTYLATEVSA